MPTHTPIIDYLGKKYGRLKITEVYPGVKSEKTLRSCKVVCDCGEIKTISLCNVTSGRTKSCGCLNREVALKKSTTHGKTGTRIYDVYCSMIHRCSPNAAPEDRKIYYDNGVRLCDEWRNDFMAFYNWAITNGYDDSLSIDRYPNQKGNYEPGNCRWATVKQQVRNREVTLLVEYMGKQRILAELAEEVKVDYPVLWKRLFQYGFTIEEAINKPIKRRVVQIMS